MTIQETFKKKDNNFTLLRLIAAFGVLYFHSYPLAYGSKVDYLYEPAYREFVLLVGRLTVDMFFVISGFLVTASFCRTENLRQFIVARMLRIFPGLFFAVIFCAFIVGPLATEIPLSNYLTSAQTYSFVIKNALLIDGVQSELPGVFKNNPYPHDVNGSLWTLPIELKLYFGVAVLGLSAILRFEKLFNAWLLLIILLYIQTPVQQFILVQELHHVRVAFMFVLGSFFYVNRSHIHLNFITFVGLLILSYFSKTGSISTGVQSVCFAYFVILCALHPLLKVPSMDRWGDISYGLYIYAFPVQQLLVYYLPSIKPIEMLMMASAITGCLAYLSWKFVESPALNLKGRIKYTAF